MQASESGSTSGRGHRPCAPRDLCPGHDVVRGGRLRADAHEPHGRGVGRGRQEALEPLGIAEHHLGGRVLHGVEQLVRHPPGVHPHRGGPHGDAGPVAEHPLRVVSHGDGDAIAGHDPLRREPARDGSDVAMGVGVGPALVAVDEVVVVRVGRAGEPVLAQRGRAARVGANALAPYLHLGDLEGGARSG